MSTTAHDPLTGPGPGPGAGPALAADDYVRRVREALADLPPDVVDDLVDGLPADLAELAAESSTPLADRLGPPAAYAGELRAAAGVAASGSYAGRPQQRGPSWSTRWRAMWAEERARLRKQTWWPAVSDFARTVRPAWWVARGAIVLALVLFVVFGVRWGSSGAGVLAQLVMLAALLGAVVVSVELGRGRWSRLRWVPRTVLVANVVAVLALPAALSWGATTPPDDYGQAGVSYVTEEVPPASGLYLDGQVVSNLYPYDAQGRPLSGVQLLDDYGRAVQVGEDQRVQWSSGTPEAFRPAVDVDGTTRWNAYPLRTGTGDAVLPEDVLPPLLVSSGGVAVTTPDPTASTPAPGASTPAPEASTPADAAPDAPAADPGSAAPAPDASTGASATDVPGADRP